MGVLSKVCAAGVLAVASHYAKAVENCETVEFNAAMAGEPEDLVTGQLCADAQVEGDVTTVTVDLVVDGNNPPAVFFGLELPTDSYLMYKLDADGNENEAELAPILALGTRDVNKDTCVRSNGAEIDPCFFARRSPLAGNFPVGRCTSKKDYNNLKSNQYENKNVCRLASEQPGDYDDLEVTATSDGKMQFSLAPGVTLGDTTKLVYGAVIRDGNNGDQTSANGEEFGNVLEVALVADPDPNAPTAQPTVSTQAPSSAPTIATVAPTSAPTQVATEPPVAVTEEPVTEAPTVEDLGNETSAPTTSTETEDPTTVVTLPPVSVDTDAPTTAPTVASFTEETKVAKVLNGDGTMEYTIKEDGVVDVVLTVMDQPDFSGFLGVGVSPSGNMVGSKAYIGKMGGSSDGVERYSLNGKSASSVVPISRRRLQDEDCGTETAMYQDGDNLVLEFCAKEIDGEPLVDSDGKLRKMVVAHGDDPELSSAHSSDNRVTFDAATAEFVEGGNGNNGGNGGSGDGDDEDGIGGGAVAGIIIAVIVVAGLVGAGVVYSKKKGSGSSSSGNEGTPAKTANDVEKQSAGTAPGQTLHHQ